MTVCIGHAEPVDVPAANDEPNPTGNSQPPHKPKTFQLNYYHCDQIGAPQELTNEQGRIVWAAQYKVWGETAPLEFLKTGTDDAAVFSSRSRPLGLAKTSDAQALNLIEQPLRFQGQYFDAETGLHYNRFRYYDPVVGRFIHQDPIGLHGGMNLFRYAVNPLGWIDVLGLTPGKTTDGKGNCVPLDKFGIPDGSFEPKPGTGKYQRQYSMGPTAKQTASVQGKACVVCGTSAPNMIADHIDALVVEHFRNGTNDQATQTCVTAVQPHCPKCSPKQGQKASLFSRLMKKKLGIKK
jgi:RHS repeat-associated protein